MSCSHANPAGYGFCGTCGCALEVARCRCGFVPARSDRFCGRCGANLTLPASDTVGTLPTVTDDNRYGLEELIAAAHDSGSTAADTAIHVSQDDIERLFAFQEGKVD